MVSRISAEFETSEIAELALKRARENVGEIYSSGIVYDKMSDKAMKLRNGTIYTVIPTAVTAHNYVTAVIESDADESVFPEPLRRRRAQIYVICSSESVKGIRSVFNSLGGLNIKTGL